MLYFLKNSASIFQKKQEDILSAAFLITLSVAISRILGWIRIRLLASYFGDQLDVLSAYFAAIALPDAVFEIFIFGTIALAFIPIFSKHMSKNKLDYAWKLTSTLISLSCIFFIVFLLIFFLFSPQIAKLIAPGLVARSPETQIMIAHLLQIIVISQLFFVISIFLTGILHSFQRFLVPALASVFYNVGIIISIIFLSPVFGIYSAALGMILGAFLHLVIQLPLILSLGFKFSFSFDFKNKDVAEMFKLMWPRSVTIGLVRISEIVNIALASVAAVGSIVALNFAQILQVIPTAFFASSISQAAFIFLSIEYNRGKRERFKKTFTQTLLQILFLVLPTAAILAVLRVPAVRLAFGAKEIPWETTVLAARTLLAFSVGIVAQAINLLLIRAFHAVRDSYTPVKVTLATTILNIALSLIFILVLKLPIIWLAFSFSMTNILTAIMLLFLLDRKIGGFSRKDLVIPILKMVTIAFVMAVSLYIPMKLLDQLVFDTTRTVGLILLTSTATIVGLAVYLVLSVIFGVKEVYIFANFLRRISSWPKKIIISTKAPPIEGQQPNP